MAKKKQANQVNEIDQTVAASKDFVERHQKSIIFGGGALIIVVVIALLMHQFYFVPREQKAAEEISAAEALFRSGEWDKALNGDGENVGFLEIIDNYGGTKSGNLAQLYAGLCYAQKGEAQTAIDYLEDFDGCGDEMVSNAALGALGNCYAEVGENLKGAKILVKAAKKADNNTLSPDYYLQAGQLYAAEGDKDKAMECYMTVKTKYFQSVAAQEIDKFIETVR
jgi:tetratricopeptide (TPR) repeat protein